MDDINKCREASAWSSPPKLGGELQADASRHFIDLGFTVIHSRVLTPLAEFRRRFAADLRNFLTLFQQLHGMNNESFRILDLLHDQPDIHCGILRLPLAPAVNAVLADEGKRVRQDIEGSGKSA